MNPKRPTLPIVLTGVSCPVCARIFSFQVPISLRKLPGEGNLYHTSDQDGLPDLWLEAENDLAAIARLARIVCELVAKYGQDGITTHYQGRLD